MKRSHYGLRLTFSYIGDKVKLVSQRPLVKRIPLLPPQKTKKASGFWIAIIDKSGKLLYQRVMENPIQFDKEIFSPDPKTPITRVKIENPKGRFSVLVPDLPEAETIELMSSPLEREKVLQSATSLATFKLRETSRKEKK